MGNISSGDNSTDEARCSQGSLYFGRQVGAHDVTAVHRIEGRRRVEQPIGRDCKATPLVNVDDPQRGRKARMPLLTGTIKARQSDFPGLWVVQTNAEVGWVRSPCSAE